MAIVFNNNFKIGIGAPIDSKYLNALNQPYANTAAVISAIPESQRYIGLTVNVANVEYWFTGSTADSCLVVKTAGGGGGTGTITGGTNGLGVDGANICLGGTLIGSTVLTIGAGNTAGIEYAGTNYTTGFSENSLVNKGYVDNKLTGTTYHIPVYNSIGNGIQESSLAFNNNILCNNDNLTLQVPNSCNIYLSAPRTGYNEITFGKPTDSTGITYSLICVAGQASDIGLYMDAKGWGQIRLTSQYISLGSSGVDSDRFVISGEALRVPQGGKICGFGGNAVIPNAPKTCIIGGYGFGYTGYSGHGGDVLLYGGNAVGVGNCSGGTIIIKAGSGVGTGATGNIKICGLPAKTSQANVVYYDTANGALSYGLASGGTGLITGGTNGIGVSGLNVCLGGALSTCPVFDGGVSCYHLQYAGDYSCAFSDYSLISKGYAKWLNESVSKSVALVSHGFSVRDVIGWSGGTYSKAIADGTYNGEILGIVSCVYNPSRFELVTAGFVDFSGYSGFLTNQTYFLSDTTAGLLTYNEPTILGHISKAMFIATSVSGGYVLPYAGYVISSGGTGDVSGEKIVKTVTQTGHTFVVGDVVGWVSGQYTKAIANGTYNGEVIGLVTRIDGNDFDVTQAGFIQGLTGLTLSANTTYFLSDVVAGALTTTKTTTLGHVIRPVFATTTTSAGWVLPYPGYILLSGGSITGGTTFTAGLGLTLTADTLNVNAVNMTAVGTPIPVKVCYGGTNYLYVDSNDISGGTTYTFIESGATKIYDDGFGNVTIYSPTPTGGTGSTVTLVGSGATQVNNVSGTTWVVYSPTGGTGGGTWGSITGTLSNQTDLWDEIEYSLTGDTQAAVDVGGIDAGYILTGKTISCILKDLLIPELFPNYPFTAPSTSISKSPTTILYEVGDTASTQCITSSFSRGAITPQYCSASPYRSGLPNTYCFTGVQISGSTGTTALSVTRCVTGYVVPLGSTSWSSCVSFDAGVQPKGSKGTNFCSPLGAGTCASGSVSVCGVYPLFATTSAIGTLTKQGLISMTTTPVTLILVGESGGLKQKFEVACGWTGGLVKCICTYNTFSGQWEWEGGSGAASLTTWTQGGSTETLCCGSANYCCFVYNGACRTVTTCIRLVF